MKFWQGFVALEQYFSVLVVEAGAVQLLALREARRLAHVAKVVRVTDVAAVGGVRPDERARRGLAPTKHASKPQIEMRPLRPDDQQVDRSSARLKTTKIESRRRESRGLLTAPSCRARRLNAPASL